MKKLIKKLLIGTALTLAAASCQPGSSGSGGGGSTPAPNPTPVPTPTPTPYEITSPTSMNVQCNTWNDYQITANKEGGTCDAESLSSEMISNVSVDDECKVDFYVTCDSDQVGTMKVSKRSLEDELAEQNVAVNASVDPITTSLSKTFGINGKVTWAYEAASDPEKLERIEVALNGTPDYFSTDINMKEVWLDIETPLLDPSTNENSIEVYVRNTNGDSATDTGSVTPTTEVGARTKIEEIFAAKGWSEGVNFSKDTTFGFIATKNCDYGNIGDYLEADVDYALSGARTINYSSFEDNLADDLTGYEKLTQCRDAGKSLQLSRFPEYEVESQTNDFID